jgi:DNA-binding response OmpR family regulator
MSKILFVEDNEETQAIFKEVFSDLSVTVCSNRKEGAQHLNKTHFDVVVLDLELPDGTAHDLMQEMQDKLKNSSVLILTAKDHFDDKEIAFKHGALDYLQKPFNPKELRLRVMSHMSKRQEFAKESNILRVGSVICNLEEQRLYLNANDKEPTDLTVYEFRIFKMLAKEPNKVISRNDLLEKIWGTTVAVTPRTIDVHVSNLRKKLQTTDVEILSKQGSGYILHIRSKD